MSSLPPDDTNDPHLESWVPSANQEGSEFPIQNLPWGVFQRHGASESEIGVAIGDKVLPMRGVLRQNLFSDLSQLIQRALSENTLCEFLSLRREQWEQTRRSISVLLRGDNSKSRSLLQGELLEASGVTLTLPCRIPNYTDFYTSIYHATNVGSLVRPENPLLPNYRYLPIAYHGRASSVVVSGTSVIRPRGQWKESASNEPVYDLSRQLDYEAELGVFIGTGNALGTPISIERADDYIFGFCLLNDWSARDIQAWEYQPLGPFLGKSFCTTISPWIVTRSALEPFRRSRLDRGANEPRTCSYLLRQTRDVSAHFDIVLEVELTPAGHGTSYSLSRSSTRDLYWSIEQMITHHTSNGCNLQPGDLLGSGTVSGPEEGQLGCLLEITKRGTVPLRLSAEIERAFLHDGDQIRLIGKAKHHNSRTIGFGSCVGKIAPNT